MKHPLRNLLSIAAFICLAGVAAQIEAQTIRLNFDSVNAGNGIDATAYLASYGITVTNISHAGSLHIKNDTNFYGSGAVFAPSPRNFLLQEVGGSPPGVSYTLAFNTPLQSLNFTRCAIGGNVATPSWTATAYAGSTPVGSVGVCCIDSDTGQPAHVYTLNGPGITSLAVSGNGANFAAMASAPFDDLSLTPGALVVTNLPVPNSLGGLAVNSALNKIYISGSNPGAEQIVKVDGATFAQIGIGTGTGIDIDATNNNYWSAGVYSGSATIWSSNDNQVASISLGYCPTGVNLDSQHRRAWVAAQCGGGNDPVWAINADTHALIAGPIGSGGVQGQTQVNPATGRFYIYPSGVSKRVNPSTFAVTANAFGVVMGVNPMANLLYAANGSTLQIINGAPDPEAVITNVPLGFSFGGYIGVNPAANRIYIGAGGSNFVAVLNATNGNLLATVSLPSTIQNVGSIAVDSARGRIYVLANSASSTYLYVFQDVAPPTITVAPISTTASAGGTVVLSVGASGYPLLYQWAFNGVPIPGANASTLTLANISAANAGHYTVTVSNGFGGLTSQAVSLALVDVQMFAGVVINGPAGAQYSVQSSASVTSPVWTTRTNVTLANQSYVYIDYSSPTNGQQFYRAVPLAP